MDIAFALSLRLLKENILSSHVQQCHWQLGPKSKPDNRRQVRRERNTLIAFRLSLAYWLEVSLLRPFICIDNLINRILNCCLLLFNSLFGHFPQGTCDLTSQQFGKVQNCRDSFLLESAPVAKEVNASICAQTSQKIIQFAVLEISWKQPKSKIIMRFSFPAGLTFSPCSSWRDLCDHTFIHNLRKAQHVEPEVTKVLSNSYSLWYSSFLSGSLELVFSAPSIYGPSDVNRRYPNPDQPLFLPLLLGKGINWWDNQTLFTLL